MRINFGPGAYRFILAMLVFVHHTSSLGFGPGAVYIFFCLSGYWMYAVWVNKYEKVNFGYRTFVVARLIRLLPLFWLANAIGYAAAIWSGKFSVDHWLEQMHSVPSLLFFVFSHLFLMGYSWLDHVIIVPAWSLVVELQFYILLPLFVALMRWAGWLVFPLSISLALVLYGGPAFETVLGYAFFFYLGMFASSFRWAPSMWVVRATTALAVFTIGVLLALPSTRAVLIGGVHQNDMYLSWNGLANALLAIMLLPLTIWSAESNSDDLDRMLGDLSYAVYLIHAPLVVVYSSWSGKLPFIERFPYWLMLVATLLLASWFSWYFLDKPVMAWRTRYLRSRL